MKKVCFTTYKFNELKTEAQERAINNYRNKDQDYSFYFDEIHESYKAFKELFKDLSIEVFEMKGVRLLKYLYNNFNSDLFKPKYYSVKGKVKPHPRIITTKSGFQGYYSAIQKDTCGVLTGICYDDSILKPIYDEFKKPSGYTLSNILYFCKQEYEKCIEDCEDWVNSDEFIKEEIINQDLDFLESGAQFNY